jgi:hypothetical protein
MVRIKKSTTETWPKVTQGSHSTRTEYENGRVEFVTDWEALQRDVRNAIADYEMTQSESAIRTKTARKKKVS